MSDRELLQSILRKQEKMDERLYYLVTSFEQVKSVKESVDECKADLKDIEEKQKQQEIQIMSQKKAAGIVSALFSLILVPTITILLKVFKVF